MRILRSNESRSDHVTEAQGSSSGRSPPGTPSDPRRTPAWLPRLLSAWVALGPLAASPLEAQTCLGFSGQGYLGASGAVTGLWAQDITGIGGAGGFRVGPVIATGEYLKFSGADKYDQEFDFTSARVALGVPLHTPSLSICPMITSGLEGVWSRDTSDFPYRSKPAYGAGLAVGRQVTGPDARVTIITSLAATMESHVVERIIEGDILINERETSALFRAGVTVEFGRVFVRPYTAVVLVRNGWRAGGVRFGLRF